MPSQTWEQAPTADPVPPRWDQLDLPDTWPDKIDFGTPSELFGFFKAIFSKRQRVQLPDDLPGKEKIPKYVLQEFHSLPNGNYSKSVARGYITGFDMAMLGTMDECRTYLANYLKDQGCVLDVGCAGGKMAAKLKQMGVDEVWGLDPSPYLLQNAAKDYPDIHFIQGVAEDTEFPSNRFDGISACFLFHELPPRYASQALSEFSRILKPGGLLAIGEPSPIQLQVRNPLKLIRAGGWTALYFKALAHFVYEPFVNAWHKTDIESWLSEHGFTLVEDQVGYPVRTILAKKSQ